MIDYSKPVQAKNGHRVTILTFTEGRGNCPIVGYIGESKTLQMWYADGRYIAASLRGSYNLVNSPEYWVKEKEAYKQGKTIQFRSLLGPSWVDLVAGDQELNWYRPDNTNKPEYRIKPELVPLTKDYIKAGDTLLNPTGYEYQWTVKSDNSVMLGSFWRTYDELKRKGWKIKSLNETEWRPCEKEVDNS